MTVYLRTEYSGPSASSLFGCPSNLEACFLFLRGVGVFLFISDAGGKCFCLFLNISFRPAAVIMQHAAQPIAAVTVVIGGMLVGNGNGAAFSFGTV